MPAKAGITGHNPAWLRFAWIPAFAGMTAVLVVLVLTIAQARAATDDAGLARAVSAGVNGYILPAFAKLQTDTEALAGAVSSQCEAPADVARKAAADEAFARIIVDWAGVDFLRFGPALADSRYDRFAFWPDPHGTGARQIRRMLAQSDGHVPKPAAIAADSAAVQGLPALEQLLYDGKSEAIDQRRCELAAAIAQNMATIAADLSRDWSGDAGWAKTMQALPASGPYRSHAEAANELLKAALTGLKQLVDQKILAATGKTPEAAKATRLPYRRSGSTKAYLEGSAAGLAAFERATGLAKIATGEDAWIAGSFSLAEETLAKALASAPEPLLEGGTSIPSWQALQRAVLSARNLQDLYANSLAPAIGLTVGFNALDGD